MKILVTGSAGLIGAQAVEYFAGQEHDVLGIDNDMRREFFGPEGTTAPVKERLLREYDSYSHFDIDIRDRERILSLIRDEGPDVIVHTAAQPSHDYAAKIPFADFEVNAVGTLNLLESMRQFRPDGIFVHLSTNKVYGDRPNTIPLQELETRWDYADPQYANGIPESFSIDQSKHSIFGASKVAGDILVQEYGRYFDLKSCVLRGGCLTGPAHAGVELHGFLSYLVKCNVIGRKYTVFGYKGKQVRDNIHSYDVVRFIEEFIKAPRVAEVYNMGGGKGNSCSILEAFKLAEDVTGTPIQYEYRDVNRIGDHICYYSDLSKMKEHYPDWDITIGLKQIVSEIAKAMEAVYLR